MELVIGIDLGTQGVRILAINNQGMRIAAASCHLDMQADKDLPNGWHEQNPLDWWKNVKECLRDLIAQLPSNSRIVGLSIDSTSGTILPIDQSGMPLYSALMYNDARSRSYAEEVHQAGETLENQLGYAFSASFALPKIVWLMKEKPEIYQQTYLFVHAADFIAGKLTGNFNLTDHSNALKTGYDLINRNWPDFIEEELGISKDKLPGVVKPGDRIGEISHQAAIETGLPAGVPVFAGATDGTAAQFASGASEPGSWVSSLGTTLVIKGITRGILLDSQKRIYCHLHPEGWWMPGGASNTGSEWIIKEFPHEDPAELDRKSAQWLPTSLIRYPLVRDGERFPFRFPTAQGFLIGEAASKLETFAAGLEGLALLEAFAYQTLSEIGADVGENIFVTDGGARSELWLQIRASILKRTLIRPLISESAMGAAILAASGAWFGSLSKAVKNMVQRDVEVEPVKHWISIYEDKYQSFIDALQQRSYII